MKAPKDFLKRKIELKSKEINLVARFEQITKKFR